MGIICLADDSHGMSRLDFSEEKKMEKKKLKLLSARVVIGTLRVNLNTTMHVAISYQFFFSENRA